jgi:uncharacterized protein YpuA (DUF1002 family)
VSSFRPFQQSNLRQVHSLCENKAKTNRKETKLLDTIKNKIMKENDVEKRDKEMKAQHS